jgi:hypothetical protein
MGELTTMFLLCTQYLDGPEARAYALRPYPPPRLTGYSEPGQGVLIEKDRSHRNHSL